MKNENTTFHKAIAAALEAMQRMIESAGTDVITAREHINAQELNAAIGAVIPVAESLKQALALYEAVIAMHRFNRQEAP